MNIQNYVEVIDFTEDFTEICFDSIESSAFAGIDNCCSVACK